MNTVSIHDAKTNLSKYIVAAKKGERVYIGGFGKPEVVLTKISSNDGHFVGQRDFSVAKGKIREKPESFSVNTDQNIASLMYGE